MIAIILHQEKLHLLERKRERDEYLKTVSLKEKNLRKKISTVYSRASNMPFFYLLFFFWKEKHTPRERWYLFFQLHLSIFCLLVFFVCCFLLCYLGV